MPILVTCKCGRKLRAKEEDAGRTVKCPECGNHLRVPDADDDDDDRPVGTRPARRPTDDDDDDDDRPVGKRSAPTTSGKALASLLLSLVFFLFCLTGLPAILLGILALKDINGSRGRLKGSGLAIAGIIIGILITVAGTPAVLIALLLPAVAKVRDAAERVRDSNNLRQIELAMHSYHDSNGELPPSVIYDQSGKPLHSWRVLLLPYLEQNFIYSQLQLDEPWDSAANTALLTVMPMMYAPPPDVPTPQPNMTFYQVFDGPGALFDSSQQTLRPLTYLKTKRPVFARGPSVTLAAVQDGTSRTLMVVEAADPVLWYKPGDLPFRAGQPLPRLGANPRRDTFNAGFADGSVRALKKNMVESNLRALITRAGGEIVNID